VRCHKNSWIYLTSTYYWWLLRRTITIRFDSKFQIIAQLFDLIRFEMKKQFQFELSVIIENYRCRDFVWCFAVWHALPISSVLARSTTVLGCGHESDSSDHQRCFAVRTDSWLAGTDGTTMHCAAIPRSINRRLDAQCLHGSAYRLRF